MFGSLYFIVYCKLIHLAIYSQPHMSIILSSNLFDYTFKVGNCGNLFIFILPVIHQLKIFGNLVTCIPSLSMHSPRENFSPLKTLAETTPPALPILPNCTSGKILTATPIFSPVGGIFNPPAFHQKSNSFPLSETVTETRAYINKGELGTPDAPTDKRKYIEEHGSFNACFSLNKRTVPSPAETYSGKMIYTVQPNGKPDKFFEIITKETK